MNSKKSEFKIDFALVGFPKSGSTWIYENLKNHKDVSVAKIKETGYFINDFTYINPILKKSRMIKSLDKYKMQFEDTSKKIKGDFSVNYIFDKTSANTLFNHNKDLKIIICLRNPIDYLYSAYYFHRNSYLGDTLSTEFRTAVLDSNPIEWFNIEKAYYSNWIKPYIKLFKNNVLFITLNDIKSSPNESLKKICKFLEINHTDDYINNILISGKVNETSRYKNKYIKKSIHFVITLLNKLNLTFLLRYFTQIDSITLILLNKFLKEPYKYDKITKKDKEFFYKLLKNDIDSLEKLIKKDLSCWKL